MATRKWVAILNIHGPAKSFDRAVDIKVPLTDFTVTRVSVDGNKKIGTVEWVEDVDPNKVILEWGIAPRKASPEQNIVEFYPLIIAAVAFLFVGIAFTIHEIRLSNPVTQTAFSLIWIIVLLAGGFYAYKRLKA